MSLEDAAVPHRKAASASGGKAAFPHPPSNPGSKLRVAVLVLNYNGARFLPACIESVLASEYPSFDVVLIDNHSNDESVTWTRAAYPNVHIIENSENMGFALAYDRAIRALEHPFVVLLNNDTTVHPRWLTALVDVLESNDRIAACGSKILMMHDPSILDHGGGLLTWIGSGLDVGKWSRDRQGTFMPTETGFACGAALLVSREAYLRVGGFDTTYVMYHEDVDLCWRLRMAGHSVLHVPSSIVYHYGGGGHSQGIDLHPSRTRFSQRNRLANILKNMGAGRVPAALAVSSLYDLLRMARSALTGKKDVLRAIIGGYGEIWSSLGDVLRKRRIVQRERVVPEREMKPHFATLAGSMIAYWKILSLQRAQTQELTHGARH